MQPTQALGISLALIDYEIEEPAYVPVPPEWKRELNAAREILSELIGLFERLPARAPEPTDWQALPEVLTAPQAAEAAKVHRSTMARFIRERRIRAAKVGGRYQIDREDLRAAIETGLLIGQKERRRRRPNRLTHPELGF